MADKNTIMGTVTRVSNAATTLRELGWRWVLSLWVGCILFALVVIRSQAQQINVLAVVAFIVAATGILVAGLWWPRLIGTAITLTLLAPFIGVIGAWYAIHASAVVSFPEVNVRMIVATILSAVLAHQLPGRPWVRLLCGFAMLCGPGLLLIKVAPDLGVFAAYLAVVAGTLVPSLFRGFRAKAVAS